MYPHWDYFLAIEADLSNVARYIEFHKSNFRTYSIELAHIILSAASEVDVIAQVLCNEINPEFETQFDPSKEKYPNMGDYRKVILEYRPYFPEHKVHLPKYDLTFFPWAAWKSTDPKNQPNNWWQAYNNIKHRRDINFSNANLGNALYSVAGLFCLVLELYRQANANRELYPEPKLLTSPFYKTRNFRHQDLQQITDQAKALREMGGRAQQ